MRMPWMEWESETQNFWKRQKIKEDKLHIDRGWEAALEQKCVFQQAYKIEANNLTNNGDMKQFLPWKKRHIFLWIKTFICVHSQGENIPIRIQHRCLLIRELILDISAATLEGEEPWQRRSLKPEREIPTWLADTVRDLDEILTSWGWQLKSCTGQLCLSDWSSTPVTEIHCNVLMEYLPGISWTLKPCVFDL